MAGAKATDADRGSDGDSILIVAEKVEIDTTNRSGHLRRGLAGAASQRL
jgi:hypothetical protein